MNLEKVKVCGRGVLVYVRLDAVWRLNAGGRGVGDVGGR